MHFDQYTVRLLEQEDAGGFFELIDTNRSRLESYFAGTVSKTQTLADTRAFVADNIVRRHNREYYPFGVFDTATQAPVGLIDVKNIDWNIPKAELGCFIDERYLGFGISKRAMLLVIDHLFCDLGMLKLFLRTHESNAEARILAEKCGFAVEGTIRKDYKTTSGEIVDLLYYGLVKE